jgi:hypothetical protein
MAHKVLMTNLLQGLTKFQWTQPIRGVWLFLCHITSTFCRMKYTILSPKIPWNQKLVDCCPGSLWEEKHFVLPIESWVFHFLQFYFLLMVLYDVIVNVTSMIWMWSFWFFFKKFYKFHSVGVLNKDSTKIILTGSYLQT